MHELRRAFVRFYVVPLASAAIRAVFQARDKQHVARKIALFQLREIDKFRLHGQPRDAFEKVDKVKIRVFVIMPAARPAAQFSPVGEHGNFHRKRIGRAALMQRFDFSEFVRKRFDIIAKIGKILR